MQRKIETRLELNVLDQMFEIATLDCLECKSALKTLQELVPVASGSRMEFGVVFVLHWVFKTCVQFL